MKHFKSHQSYMNWLGFLHAHNLTKNAVGDVTIAGKVHHVNHESEVLKMLQQSSHAGKRLEMVKARKY